MSNEARILKIHDIKPIEGADRIEVAVLEGDAGFCCVVGKGTYSVGDLTLFIEPDSVIPDNIVEQLKTTSKINVSNRIRAIKIRGVISEGLCLKPEEWIPKDKIEYGFDASELLDVKHYEPKEPKSFSGGSSRKRSKNLFYNNEYFLKFPHIDRVQKHPNVLSVGEPVVATCKRHGQNIRFYYGKKSDKAVNSFWHKVKRFFHLTEDTEFLVGSHNTIRNPGYKPEDAKHDHFLAAAEKYNMRELMPSIADFLAGVGGNRNLILYGEVIGYSPRGEPLQVGYNYGLPKGELDVVFYDILVGGQFLDWCYVESVCRRFNLPIVETVYKGPFDLDVLKLAEAVDEYNGQKYNREGIVIKPLSMRKDPRCGWVELKEISNIYKMDKANTEYH